MMNNNLDEIWAEIESTKKDDNRFYSRMIYINLLYRVFAGISGIPSKRYLSIEIPQNQINKIESFTMPQGINLSIEEPGIRHEGFHSCMIQASSSEQNDVFTIVATDILNELSKQEEKEKYIEALKNRIEKWRLFFKSVSSNKLSDKAVIGLFGELSVVDILQKQGFISIVNYWNGPIKSAQDFQSEKWSIEVKTVLSSSLETIHISSEVQLDDSNMEALFLIANRIVKCDSDGISLPELINKITLCLSEHQKNQFYAKLLCLGYSEKDAQLYKQRFSLKESRIYKVSNGFPRLISGNLPDGVNNTEYSILISRCEPFIVDEEMVYSVLRGE